MSYWIGQLGELLLLFDQAAQIPGSPHVFLWSSDTQSMEKYMAEMVRPLIKPAAQDDQATQLARRYDHWKRDHLDHWISQEKQYYASRSQQEAIRRNEQALRAEASRKDEQRRARAELMRVYAHAPREQRSVQFDVEYLKVLGLRRPATMRSNKCFACKAPLVSASSLECVHCGWLVCQCGACGCKYIPD